MENLDSDFAHIKTVDTQFDGLAALTAVRELVKTLIAQKIITPDEGLDVFLRSAAMHKAVDAKVSTNANLHCAEALRQCAEDIGACMGT